MKKGLILAITPIRSIKKVIFEEGNMLVSLLKGVEDGKKYR
jgi:hypothetical protein